MFDTGAEGGVGVGIGFWPKQNSCQCRAKRQSGDTTESDRTGDSDAELGKERTARAGHESDRDEHRHEDERTTDDCHRHFAHRIFGGLVRRLVTRLHLRHHRFDDHYRIIDDRSDSEHQGKERKDIE